LAHVQRRASDPRVLEARPAHLHRPPRWHARARALIVPVAYAVVGAAVGVAAVSLDGAVRAPEAMQFGTSTARALTTGFAASFVFVVSVVFWVRLYAMQVAAELLTPRVQRTFLSDRVDRNAMGFIVGALACTIVVARAVPGDGDSGTVPHLSVALVCVLAVVVALTIVAVVHNASRWTEAGRIVRWIADECTATVIRTHPARSPGADPTTGTTSVPAPPRHDPDQVVTADESGWVHDIDELGLLAGLPPGTIVALPVRAGEFLMAGTPVASVWYDDGFDPTESAVEHRVRSAVSVKPDLDIDGHLPVGIGQLTDIAERSLAEGSSDTTTVRQVIVHLGMVLRELLMRDLPTSRVQWEDRVLIGPDQVGFDDYVSLAFDQIRLSGGGRPEVAIELLRTLDAVIADLRRVGSGDRTEPLHRQADLVLHTARDRAERRHDFERVLERSGVQTQSKGHEITAR
jgi:uncharacterized membrane protein